MAENLFENLLPKLEEKMMLLLTELEDARREIQRLCQENSLLKSDMGNYSKKLMDLLSLLDSVNQHADHLGLNMATATSSPPLKPVLVQEKISSG
jgi:regulator of replication initiation timing